MIQMCWYLRNLEEMVFFSELMPHYNGISVIDKSLVPVYNQLEVDACLCSL